MISFLFCPLLTHQLSGETRRSSWFWGPFSKYKSLNNIDETLLKPQYHNNLYPISDDFKINKHH